MFPDIALVRNRVDTMVDTNSRAALIYYLLTEMNLSTATASVVNTEAVRAIWVRPSSTGNKVGRILIIESP